MKRTWQSWYRVALGTVAFVALVLGLQEHKIVYGTFWNTEGPWRLNGWFLVAFAALALLSFFDWLVRRLTQKADVFGDTQSVTNKVRNRKHRALVATVNPNPDAHLALIRSERRDYRP